MLRTNPRYPGFAFLGEPPSPSTEACFYSDLALIQSRSLGADLLADIARASPGVRKITNGNDKDREINFPKNINVIVRPTTMTFYETGIEFPSRRIYPPVPGRNFYPKGGCMAIAGDVDAAGNGTGSVSLVNYTNTQLFTGKGEKTFSFIVLAHELIHSLNHLQGRLHNDDEEQRTTGLNQYASEKYSENAFRQAFLLESRQVY